MIRVESSDFHAAAVAAKEADKTIIRDLRKGIRLAGAGAVVDVRANIARIPSSGRHGTGVRAALAAGTRVSIGTASARSAGVRIVTDPRRLPAKRRAMAKSLNLATFRHPVLGNRDVWVEQAGRPYFGRVILARKAEMQSEIWRSLSRAEAAIMAKQQRAAADVQ